jgi:hypothetical protein
VYISTVDHGSSVVMLSVYTGNRLTPRGLPARASRNVGSPEGSRTSGGGWPALATCIVQASGSITA